MKKGNIFGALLLIAAATSVATYKIARRLKSKKYNDEVDENYNHAEDYDVEDTSALEFKVFAFDNANDMHLARLSGKFDVDSYYEFEDKSYLVVFVEGNEHEMEEYGGVELTDEEMDAFYERTIVETMYFWFEKKEYASSFLEAISYSFNENTRIPMAHYDIGLYVDLSSLDKKFERSIKHTAIEFYGEQITDLYIINKIKPLFDVLS